MTFVLQLQNYTRDEGAIYDGPGVSYGQSPILRLTDRQFENLNRPDEIEVTVLAVEQS